MVLREYKKRLEEARLQLVRDERQALSVLIERRSTIYIQLGPAYCLSDGRLLGTDGEVDLDQIPLEKYDVDTLKSIGDHIDRALESPRK